MVDFFALSRNVPLQELVIGEVLDVYIFGNSKSSMQSAWDRWFRDFRKLEQLQDILEDSGQWQGQAMRARSGM